MKILILMNERSGKGRAADRVRAAVPRLERAGHSVRVAPLADRASVRTAWTERPDLLVAAGGDGTVLAAAELALSSPVDPPSVYHLPCGNENLFAREFGMDALPETLERAVAAGRRVPVDVGWAGDDGTRRLFLVMASVGFDASVVHRLDASRKEGGGHSAYVRPIVDELMRPAFPRLTVRVDGETVVDRQRGLVVVANSRQYAMRLNPAPAASMTDGVLDVVFLPCASRTRALWWAALCRLRRHTRAKGVVTARGTEVQIEGGGGSLPCQLDGEAHGAGDRLLVRVSAAALPVHVPG